MTDYARSVMNVTLHQNVLLYLADHNNSAYKGIFYQCGKCDKNLQVKYYLRRHYRIHARRKYCCDFCDFLIDLKHGVSNHILSV